MDYLDKMDLETFKKKEAKNQLYNSEAEYLLLNTKSGDLFIYIFENCPDSMRQAFFTAYLNGYYKDVETSRFSVFVIEDMTKRVSTLDEAIYLQEPLSSNKSFFLSFIKLAAKFPGYVEACIPLWKGTGSKFPKELVKYLLSCINFKDEIYEKLFDLLSKETHLEDYEVWDILTTNHAPSSFLYLACKSYPSELRKALPRIRNHRNLTPEIIAFFPESMQYLPLMRLSDGNLFDEINQKLAKPRKKLSLAEGLQTEAFKATMKNEKYKQRETDFDLLGIDLQASQKLAETLVVSLNEKMPVDLKNDLEEVKAKTLRLYTFYESVLSSPFNVQGDRAVSFAKKSAEEALEDYEEVISELLNLTESEKNSRSRREGFDKLKANTKTCVEMETLELK